MNFTSLSCYHIFIGDPIYCNYLEGHFSLISETWMDLDETWQVGLGPEKTTPCTFPAKSRYGFRREREKWVADPLFFCDLNDTPLLPLSSDQFPPNFPRTRAQWWLATYGFTFQKNFHPWVEFPEKPSF